MAGLIKTGRVGLGKESKGKGRSSEERTEARKKERL